MRRLPVMLALLASGGTAWAYGEDIQDDNRSTAHYDMTRTMARCAGFTADDATAIAEADQVADSLTYANTHLEFASRTGPSSSTFHFPQAEGAVDDDGNGFLRDWALGAGTLPLDVCDANGRCCDPGTDRCAERGTNQALGLWLHAVADYWSHHACIEAGGMNHGMYNHDDEVETYYCDSTIHSHEWGRRDTDPQAVMLQDNALQGLMTVRAQLEAIAQSRGYVACGRVTDEDLVTFSSTIGGTARASTTAGLYSTCDAVVGCGPVAPGSEGDIDTMTSEATGCGCASTDAGSSALFAFAMLAMVVPRKRR